MGAALWVFILTIALLSFAAFITSVLADPRVAAVWAAGAVLAFLILLVLVATITVVNHIGGTA